VEGKNRERDAARAAIHTPHFRLVSVRYRTLHCAPRE
jgi:hypothetical protein